MALSLMCDPRWGPVVIFLVVGADCRFGEAMLAGLSLSGRKIRDGVMGDEDGARGANGRSEGAV